MTTTREGVTRIERDLPHVDVVLLNYGLVDSWVTTIPMIYIPYFPETPSKRLARKFLKSAKRRLRSPWVRRWIPRGEVVSLEEYDANLRRIIALLRQVNPEVLVVLWATANVRNHPERNGNINRYNAQLGQIAGDTNCLFVETATVLNSVPDENCFIDGVHLSNESYRCLGIAMAETLLTQLVNSPVKRPFRTAA